MPITLNGTTGITTPADTITGNATVGGTLTVGGVNAVAVAPGANGNVLTSNGTVWTSAAPASTASLTLLATLTTTSGTTQSATGLPTTYTNFLIVVEEVNNATGISTIFVAASSNNGASYGTARATGAAGQPASGITTIARANASSLTKAMNQDSFIQTTSAAPINALRFNWSGSYTFTAGTIYIYGWN